MSSKSSANNLTWPPAYTLIKSKRAKRISIKIDYERGLCLVLPENAKTSKAEEFLSANRAWVERHMAKLPPCQQEFVWPEHLSLPAIPQSWDIKYHAAPEHRPILLEVGNTLNFYGDRTNSAAFARCLKSWVLHKAKVILPQRLSDFARREDKVYQKCSVRWQRSIWGSCSASASISLNAKLLFHQPQQLDYVLWHELCHLDEMNHSTHFWQSVERVMPDYKKRRDLLKQDVVPIFLR